MGITHFTGLGKSPGAVTAGLSYIKHEYGEYTKEYGAMVERVVIFTSEEIANGDEKAHPSVYNKYMTRNIIRGLKTSENSLEVVGHFLKQKFKDIEICVYVVNVNSFEDCFEIMAQALLKFHPRERVGKHIWVNLTGGTNILNAALMQIVYLSGLVPVMYYTFVANMREDGKYLNPFSRNESEFYFRKIDVFKTTFDMRFRCILEELEKLSDYIKDEELLSRLKNSHLNLFGEFNMTIFKRDYLNVMDGWCIERRESDIRLNKNGKSLLNKIRSPLFTVLIGERYQENIETLLAELKRREVVSRNDKFQNDRKG